MKKTLTLVITLILISGVSIHANAQQKKFSEQIFWVVETNLNQQDYSIVRFYNMKNRLVYEVKLYGLYIDTTKPKHKKILNDMMREFTSNSEALAKVDKVKKITLR